MPGDVITRRNLSTNGDRLWATLMETAAIGATPDGGIRRLTLSEEDRRVRDWFKGACEAAGAQVAIDGVGNMFAHRQGIRPDLPPIAIGSHLDTQPTGGKFDGVLGVLAGLEVFRSLEETGYRTEHPLVLVNWTNEEGARFTPAMLGSAVHAGALSIADLESVADADGIRFSSALDAIGYRGAEPVGATRIGAYFELHIEQGPILERNEATIGVVTGIQGIRWYDLTIRGQSAHAGTTPLDMRRDALLSTAGFIVALDALARSRHGVATIGCIEVSNPSRNVVPGEVRLTVDIRHPDENSLEEMERAMEALFQTLAPGLEVRSERIWISPPVPFNPACIEAVEQAAREAGLSSMPIVSGAGHDAGNLARVVPTAMIFVPCLDGLSHNPAESATPAHCAMGAKVLLDAVLAYDRRALASGSPPPAPLDESDTDGSDPW